jgi:hypothetical protein
MARVFAVMAGSSWTIRVSWYKVECEPYISHRLQTLCVAVARSGLVTSYKSVIGTEAKAKTMTSLLIIPSVLGFRSFFFIIMVQGYLLILC